MTLTLDTPRLHLRPVRIEDARPITEAVQDPRVYRNVARIPPGQTLAMTLTWLSSLNQSNSATNYVWAITERPHDKLIGLIGAQQRWQRAVFEIGYWLTGTAFGKGFATEATRAVCDRLAEDGSARAFTAGYFFDNPASGNVLRKAGFLPCGRGAMDCLGRGEKVDHILMVRVG